MPQTRAYDYTVEAIEHMLLGRLTALAMDLAPDGEKRGNEWVAINPARPWHRITGSFSINLATGKWADFASGDKYSRAMPCLSLVAYLATQGRYKSEEGKPGAVRWARDWLGLTDRMASPAKAKAIEEQVRRAAEIRQKEEAARAENKRRIAQAMWLAAKPLTGDCGASRYLLGRGIDVNTLAGGIPGALRFAERCTYYFGENNTTECPALLAAMHRNGAPGGGFAAVHRTYIKPNGGNWIKAFGGESKRMLGSMRGATIRLTKGESGRPLEKCPQAEWIAIGEGIENCLSAALVAPEWRILAAGALNNIGEAILPPQIGGVKIIADNDQPSPDPNRPGPRELLEKVCNKLAFDRGIDIKVVHAPAVFKDFNDALMGKRSGVSRSQEEGCPP